MEYGDVLASPLLVRLASELLKMHNCQVRHFRVAFVSSLRFRKQRP